MGIFRLFLACSVLLGHTEGHGFFGLSFVYPEVAVQSFFIISGFYMALVLNEKYNRPGCYGTFLRQRFLRLYPTYFILILAVVLVDSLVWAISGHAWGTLQFWHDHLHILSPGMVVFLVLENLVIFGQEVIMLFKTDPATGVFHLFWHDPLVKPLEASYFMLIGPSWSLAVESSFYIVAPFIVCRSARIQFVALMLCFLIRAMMFLCIPYNSYHWIYSLFPPNLFFFVAGSLSYILYRKHANRLRNIALSQPWIIGLFGLLGLDYCRYPHARQLYLIWMPLMCVMVPLLFALTSRNRLDRLIGELSYPCYLMHAHVLMFTEPLLLRIRSSWLIGPSTIILTLLLSYLFYRFIELKTERYRESIYQKSQHAHRPQGPAATAPPASPLPILHQTNKVS